MNKIILEFAEFSYEDSDHLKRGRGRPKAGEEVVKGPKIYTVFKITFPDGQTHYGRKHSVSTPSGYAGYLLSNVKTLGTETDLHEKVKEFYVLDRSRNLADDIEVVFQSESEQAVVDLMKKLVKDDPDSMNHPGMIRQIGQKAKASKVVVLKRDTFIDQHGVVFIKKSIALADESLKKRVGHSLSDQITIGGTLYLRVKNKNNLHITMQVVTAPNIDYRAAQYTRPETVEIDLSDLSPAEILQRIREVRAGA